MVDRLAYWFNGHFELADREFEYYFTYQYNVIYYDHYFAEIPEDDIDVYKRQPLHCSLDFLRVRSHPCCIGQG